MDVNVSCIFINQECIRSRVSSRRGLEVSVAWPVGGWVCYIGDKTQITVVGVQRILYFHASSNSSIQSPNSERTRSDIFHIRVITKHTKVDTLFYIVPK
jgi:hypothetical protein